jgi:ADP-L-glycero-D-manno-heptose 6-epimerase
MKVLVSGACGFIGRELIKDLQKRKHTIVAMDSGKVYTELLVNGVLEYEEFMDWEYCLDNISYDHLDGVDFAYVLGANSSTRATSEELKKPNLDSPSALITQLNLKGIPVVFASSGAVYGSKFKGNYSYINPLTNYGKSKRMMENWIEYFPLGNVIALRYHNVYGATESHKGNMASIISKWIDNYHLGIMTNELFYGSDKIKRDFIHVSDVNKINIMFLDFYKKYNQLPDISILDVGSGRATSFQEVANEIVKHTKGSIQSIINPYDETNYQFYTRANIKGISDTYKWLYDKEFEPMSIRDGVKLVFNQRIAK